MFGKKMLLAVVAMVVLYGCAGGPGTGTVSKSGEIEREWVEEGITDHYIFARGIGAADQKMDNKTQQMATSRYAAIVNAHYHMLSLIKGVNLEGGITVSKAMETDSNLTTSINAAIKGAQACLASLLFEPGQSVCSVTKSRVGEPLLTINQPLKTLDTEARRHHPRGPDNLIYLIR